MRYLLASFLGVLLMAVAAKPTDGQVKDEKPKEPYTQFVKWESLDREGKVTATIEKVPALPQPTKAPTWKVASNAVVTGNNGSVPKQARITTTDGKVVVFKEVRPLQNGSLLCIVDESAPVKKD